MVGRTHLLASGSRFVPGLTKGKGHTMTRETKEAHDKRRADDDTWRNGISTAYSVYDALGLP